MLFKVKILPVCIKWLAFAIKKVQTYSSKLIKVGENNFLRAFNININWIFAPKINKHIPKSRIICNSMKLNLVFTEINKHPIKWYFLWFCFRIFLNKQLTFNNKFYSTLYSNWNCLQLIRFSIQTRRLKFSSDLFQQVSFVIGE